ncbi:hypothetical protein FYK55_07530 [Roseiconus nitratireducens]|uniref:Uncharacterized protein n=1 Tax=Roseiconus nitratireducens TaxID=2605748 RepID=A0A5M6DDA0_9BACT|nr:hypothetical protein [Roseiconus nitratireducens]KAA5545488.1 hypothetical protein FYK55_07530 [Roseiconus nitratireducens]
MSVLKMVGSSRPSLVYFVLLCLLIADGLAQTPEVDPQSLEFRRQATRRMIFDRSEQIPLALLDPDKIVGFDLMHPAIAEQQGETSFVLGDGRLKLATSEGATSTRWVGGFNPFATYEVSLRRFEGSGQIGLRFDDTRQDNHLSACIIVDHGKYQAVRWVVVKDGKEVSRQEFAWPSDAETSGAVRLRVQMLAVGANLYIESQGTSHLVGYPDFNEHLELRRKELVRRFEFGLFSDLQANAAAEIDEVTSALTPGCGQADIRAITTRDGAPLLDQGRVWLTMTVRGRALPHPLQGVFSMNPSVFDLRFEGIIVFDMGDGLWRNELASHLFFDEPSGQWRGWTTGFSAFGATSQKEEKAILAVWSDRDPRRGFSVMQARPIGLAGQHEDPHGVYDADAKKWRLLLSERAGKYRAGMWESDRWDDGYERLAGPVEMDSTGTLIQTIGASRYVFFGSADRKVYIRTYPDLEPVGELKMRLPPWNENTGTRIWPNIIPLPSGYPAPYIALMMDRQNYADMPDRNWTYGAMYLFHAHP